jgi:hypothetical protein
MATRGRRETEKKRNGQPDHGIFSQGAAAFPSLSRRDVRKHIYIRKLLPHRVHDLNDMADHLFRHILKLEIDDDHLNLLEPRRMRSIVFPLVSLAYFGCSRGVVYGHR